MSVGAEEIWFAGQAVMVSIGTDPPAVRQQALRDAQRRYRRIVQLAADGDADCIDELLKLVGDPPALASLDLDVVDVVSALTGPELIGAYRTARLGLDDQLRLHHQVRDDGFLPRLERDILANAAAARRRDVVRRFETSTHADTATEAHRLLGHFLAEDLAVVLAGLNSLRPQPNDHVDDEVAEWLTDPSTVGSDLRSRIEQLLEQVEVARATFVGNGHLVALRSLFAEHPPELAQWHLRAEHLCRRAEAWLTEAGSRTPTTAAAVQAEIDRVRVNGRAWATTYTMLPSGALLLTSPATTAQLPVGPPCPYCYSWYVPQARFCSQCGAERGTLPSQSAAHVAATSGAAEPLAAIGRAVSAAERLTTAAMAATQRLTMPATAAAAPRARTRCDGVGLPAISSQRYSGTCPACGLHVPVGADGLILD